MSIAQQDEGGAYAGLRRVRDEAGGTALWVTADSAGSDRGGLEERRTAFAGVRGEEAAAALTVVEVVEACEGQLGLEGKGGVKQWT
jgi:hypothetical protein